MFTQLDNKTETQLSAYLQNKELIEALLLYVTNFDELIILNPDIILNILCERPSKIAQFVEMPEQLNTLLRELGPPLLEYVIAKMDLSWFMNLIKNLDDLTLITCCLSYNDHTAFLETLDDEWLMKLLAHDIHATAKFLYEFPGYHQSLLIKENNKEEALHYIPIHLSEMRAQGIYDERNIVQLNNHLKTEINLHKLRKQLAPHFPKEDLRLLSHAVLQQKNEQIRTIRIKTQFEFWNRTNQVDHAKIGKRVRFNLDVTFFEDNNQVVEDKSLTNIQNPKSILLRKS